MVQSRGRGNGFHSLCLGGMSLSPEFKPGHTDLPSLPWTSGIFRGQSLRTIGALGGFCAASICKAEGKKLFTFPRARAVWSSIGALPTCLIAYIGTLIRESNQSPTLNLKVTRGWRVALLALRSRDGG